VLYAKSGDVHIAYTVRGSGADVVWCPGSFSHQELFPQVPELAGSLDAAAAFARVIFFDKRGTGMSDRPAGIPTLEERIDDIRSVMDAASSGRAHIFGISEGGSMACLFAATYPERTRSLVLYGTRPRWTRAPDYPWGPTPEESEARLQESIASGFKTDWTSEQGRAWLGTGLRDDPHFIEQFERMRRLSATPAAMIALSRMNGLIDVRGILGSIRVPTLVVGKTKDPVMSPECGRDLASRIPGARFVVITGEGHLLGQNAPEFTRIAREWVTEVTDTAPSERFLATILFVDLVRSTERVTAIGDAAWRDLLSRYYVDARRELALYGGVEVDTAGDGLLAHFDGPGRALKCARAIERAARDLGLEARAGVHTGEVERDATAVRGIAVHTAARIAAMAGANEVLVSSTVRDLVAGSGLAFVDRGMHELKGIQGPRQVLALG
jgi:pimeloyl-ACP methyl ester carboxylesterase/plasmid stabilization system protein ParE